MRIVTIGVVFSVVACVSTGALAQNSNDVSPPTGATAICKDGSFTTETKKRLACKDHDGIKEWKGSRLKSGASNQHEMVPSMAPNAADAPAEPGAATTPLTPKN